MYKPIFSKFTTEMYLAFSRLRDRVGSAKFSQITSSYFRVPYALSPPSENLEQAKMDSEKIF